MIIKSLMVMFKMIVFFVSELIFMFSAELTKFLKVNASTEYI